MNEKLPITAQTDNFLKALGALIRSFLPTLYAVKPVSKAVEPQANLTLLFEILK